MSIEQYNSSLSPASAAGSNERARAYALRHTVKTDNLIPATVSYQSQGRLLLVGPRIASAAPPASCRKGRCRPCW